MIETFEIGTLAEFYEALALTAEEKGKKEALTRLWFRGQSYNYYSLVPSLYRDNYHKSANWPTYTQMNLKEDYRYQHFKARTFHSIKTEPKYQSEWQEIYQHHFGHTRLMDWTESARTALSFALEPYIDTWTDRELEYKRANMTPCVWILDPYRLNEKIYEYFGNRLYPRMEKTFALLYEKNKFFENLCNRLKGDKDIYFDTGNGDLEIRGIISLCAIEDYRNNLGGNVVSAVKSGEFNPFYYLALRMYSDAVPFEISCQEDEILPPIALLHPYHSERIRAQRGAFTMFPNYLLTSKMSALCQNRKTNICSMENQPYIQDCLKVIYILDPHKVARELMISGERRSELYPDIRTYADIIETGKYYY